MNIIDKTMDNLTINSSRASLRANSQRVIRLVRKPDNNLMINSTNRSRSKSKLDRQNDNFSCYINQQLKIPNVNNIQETQLETKDKQQKLLKTVTNTQPVIKCTPPLATRVTIIQRGNRYIQQTNHNNFQKQINQNNIQIKQKKRQPTPVKSKKQLPQIQKIKTQYNQFSDLQLLIQGLQQRLKIQKNQKQKTTLFFNQLNKDKQNLKNKIFQIQKINQKLIIDNQKYQAIITQQEKIISQSSINLSNLQNNLNKLKLIDQLQQQKTKYLQINSQLKSKLAKLQSQNLSLTNNLKQLQKQIIELKKQQNFKIIINQQQIKQQNLTKQLQQLKKQNQQYKKQSPNEKHQFLQNLLSQKDKQIYTLSQQLTSCKVKIHCFQQYQSKQINELKQKNTQQIKQLKIKYSKMISEFKNKKNNLYKNYNHNNNTSRPISPSYNTINVNNNQNKINFTITCKSSITNITPNKLSVPNNNGNNMNLGQYYNNISINGHSIMDDHNNRSDYTIFQLSPQ